MGLYNYLEFEEQPDLPGVESYPEDVVWQTKSVEPNFMERLRVTADGRLEREVTVDKVVPKEERPYPDAEEGSIKALAGSMTREHIRWEDLEYHGVVEFIGKVDGEWQLFGAKFADGELVDIQRVER